MALIRPQWPHTIDDIVKALDGVWGVVGAVAPSGNLLRLERSMTEPEVYTLTEYNGQDDSRQLSQTTYEVTEKSAAVKEFAKALGFTVV